MQPESRKYLFDIQTACRKLLRFTANKRFDHYREDDVLLSAVERQFEIIGEAISQLARIDSEAALGISERGRIIAFRNILIHGYAVIDDTVVWDIVETKLPALAREIRDRQINPAAKSEGRARAPQSLEPAPNRAHAHYVNFAPLRTPEGGDRNRV